MDAGAESSQEVAVADLHGENLDTCPPWGPNSFNFMQFLGTRLAILHVGTPTSVKFKIRHCVGLNFSSND